MIRPWAPLIFLITVGLGAGGCVVKFSQRSSWDIERIQSLSEELEQIRGLAQLKAQEADQLRRAKALLDQRFAQEIADEEISIGFDERGLVVRVLDRVLFDSGKATLRNEALPVLTKVARILNEELAGQSIGVEGHTDNEPIKRSGWKDNWELSLARARAVVTSLVSEHGVDPNRVAAIGYGEYRPIASNETAEGRRLNRRVEITVLPSRLVNSRTESPEADADPQSPYRK